MASREWFGLTFVAVGVVLAPVAIIYGRMWWIGVVVSIVVGLALFLSRRVLDEEEKTGHLLRSGPGGLGLGAHRPASVAPERGRSSDGDASDGDGD
jgi:membrane protein implicated in regulation of membrane protease activity